MPMVPLYHVQSRNYETDSWMPRRGVVGMSAFVAFDDAKIRARELLDAYVRIVCRNRCVWVKMER